MEAAGGEAVGSDSVSQRDDGSTGERSEPTHHYGTADVEDGRASNQDPVREAIVAMTAQVEALEQAINHGVRDLGTELESLRTAVNSLPTICGSGEHGQNDHDVLKHLCGLVLSKADLVGRRLAVELAGVTGDSRRVADAISNLHRADRSTIARLRRELTEMRSLLGAKTGEMQRLLDEIDGSPGYSAASLPGATISSDVIGALARLRGELSSQLRDGLSGLRSVTGERVSALDERLGSLEAAIRTPGALREALPNERTATGNGSRDVDATRDTNPSYTNSRDANSRDANSRDANSRDNGQGLASDVLDNFEQGVLRELRSALHDNAEQRDPDRHPDDPASLDPGVS